MNVNLTSSIVISAVEKQRDKGKEEVSDRDEENSVFSYNVARGTSELTVCWTMWVREGFNTTATKEFQII
jgi:hypothetical protein